MALLTKKALKSSSETLKKRRAVVQIPPISRFLQMISFYFDYFSDFEKS